MKIINKVTRAKDMCAIEYLKRNSYFIKADIIYKIFDLFPFSREAVCLALNGEKEGLAIHFDYDTLVCPIDITLIVEDFKYDKSY